MCNIIFSFYLIAYLNPEVYNIQDIYARGNNMDTFITRTIMSMDHSRDLVLRGG
jgi:hypothetical protein